MQEEPSKLKLLHNFIPKGIGGTPRNSWWGCAARFSKSWPYFRPKNVIFHTRFLTWPLKSIPIFRPAGGQKNATLPQGPEEMCLSEREETNLGPIFESLKLKWKLNETCPFFLLGSCALVALRTTCCAPQGYGLRLLIFKVANNKVDLGQIRSEEIVYSRFIKIPLG